MSAKASPASPQGSMTRLEPGTLVGGRFAVEQTAHEDALGVVLRARDQKTGKAIALRVLAAGLVRDNEAAKALRTACRTAASLSHRNIVGTYGVGADPQGGLFVACEWIDGTPLSQLLEQRKGRGDRLSLRGAYNVIAHVCKGLTHAHAQSCHGALRPSVVWVSRSGRVKVGDFGVGLAVVRAAGATALGPQEQPCLAPEVKAGGAPTASSDIFGVGALLYEMLTGLSPAEGFTPPSQAHPDATEEIDRVLLKCLAADPTQRYESPDEVRTALLDLVGGAPVVPAEEEFGVDVDIDVDLASIAPPPARAAAPARAPHPAPTPADPGAGPSTGERPKVGARVSLHEPFRASLAESAAAGEAPLPQAAEVDLSSLLAKITENDAPRWMVVKNNLDHGPFSGRELVELILKGEMLAEHVLLNMDTGERKSLEEWPDFTEFLEQYKLKKRQEDERVALARSEKVEKRSNVAKLVAAAAVVGVLALGAGIFVVTRQAANDEEIGDVELADLYEKGEIEITGSAGILPDPAPSRRARRGRRARSRASGGSMSYEEAMNQAVEMDLNKAGGEARLTSQQVAGVMNQHINKFFGCVSQELRGGGQLGQVQIDLAIAGSGQVLGASVRQGSAQFKGCIERKARSVRFPSFSAPRMGARYSFSVD